MNQKGNIARAHLNHSIHVCASRRQLQGTDGCDSVPLTEEGQSCVTTTHQFRAQIMMAETTHLRHSSLLDGSACLPLGYAPR